MSGFLNKHHVSFCADMYPCVGVIMPTDYKDSRLPIHSFELIKGSFALGSIGREACVFPLLEHERRTWCVRTSKTSPQCLSLCSAAWGMCVTETGRAGVHRLQIWTCFIAFPQCSTSVRLPSLTCTSKCFGCYWHILALYKPYPNPVAATHETAN